MFCTSAMDIGGVEDTYTARQRAVESVRQRVVEQVAGWMSAEECLQLVLCASTRTPDGLIGFMFPSIVKKAAMSELGTLSIKMDEWAALFGSEARPTRTSSVDKLVKEKKFADSVSKLNSALRCTISEKTQGQSWERPFSKLSCFFSMHTEDHECLISSCLSNLVSADSRRLDEVRTHMDDEGIDVFLLANVVIALANSVT